MHPADATAAQNGDSQHFFALPPFLQFLLPSQGSLQDLRFVNELFWRSL
jgi:hypothetical protein